MSENQTINETSTKPTKTKINDYYTLASRSSRGAAADAASRCIRPLDDRAPWQVAL